MSWITAARVAAITVAGQHFINAGVLLNSDAAITVTGSADQLTLGGAVADGGASHGLTLAGTGTLELGGPNTYTGPTNVSSGTLLLSNAQALQSSTLSSSGAVAFNSSVPFHGFSVGGLSGNGNLALADIAANPVTLSVGGGNAATTYNGTISGPGSLTLVGGNLTLGSANKFTGNTLLAGGTLVLGNSNALQRSTLDTGGGGTLSSGTLASISLGGLTGSGNVNPAIATNLIVGNGDGSSVFPGTLGANVNNLTKTGAGMFTLSGNNSYSGSTAVNNGVLQIQGDNARTGRQRRHPGQSKQPRQPDPVDPQQWIRRQRHDQRAA